MGASGAGPLGYGLIGAGDFGVFCIEQYRAMDEVRPVAVADVDPARAKKAGEQFGLAVAASPAELLARDDVEIVHIATPPFTHKEIVLDALAAGKHVLCEKPLATSAEDARLLVEEARAAGRVLSVNLIMRYNPLCEAVKKIIDAKLLGEPLHGYFENYAGDEKLSPGHWFWDREKSGGIFIEHGVHFFDLFAWWLGAGKVAAAQQTVRPGLDAVEQVNCTVTYGGVPVNFYHGFTQPARMDRQEMRLLFERGSVSLDEWVPTRIRIDAILDLAALKKLRALAPGPEPREIESYSGPERSCTGRHKELTVDGRYEITLEAGMAKQELYGHILRSLLADQVAAVRDPKHARRVDESDGLISVEVAAEADRLAREA